MATGRKPKLIFFVLSLSLLLLLATTAGNVWHHHATQSAESNCPICHLGHQPAQQPGIGHATPVLLAIASSAPEPEPVFPFGPSQTRRATRAPPAL